MDDRERLIRLYRTSVIFSCVRLDRAGLRLTLTWCRERRKLHLRQRRPLGVHQEVVEERHLFFHLLNFIPVLVQDVLSYKFWALGMKLDQIDDLFPSKMKLAR